MNNYFQAQLDFLDKHREKLFPLLLFLIAVISYAIQSLWLGFYWDDWPKVLFLESIGPQAFSEIAAHRPLNGKWYVLLTSLIGARPFAWQMIALFFRILSAIAFWVLLKNIWPKSKDFSSWGAILFLIYPGFTQQNIAFTYYIHFLALSAILFSFYLTIRALQSSGKRNFLHFLALVLSLINMLTTDYFYGLELLRPLIIAIIIWKPKSRFIENIRSSLRKWTPYLMLVIVIFAWRSTLDAPESYEIAIFDNFLSLETSSWFSQIGTMFIDIWDASFVAWFRSIPMLLQFNSNSKISWISVSLFISIGILLYIFYYSPKQNPPMDAKIENQRSKLIFAFAALFLANIPVWVSGLEASLEFPANRLNLPMAAGASILMIAMIKLIAKSRIQQLLILSTIVGLSVSYHFLISNSYREDFEKLISFQQQLAWRVPALLENTAILTQELPLDYVSDDSLTGMLNIIYPSTQPKTTLNNALFFMELRLGSKIPSLSINQDIFWKYRLLEFSGNTSQSIVLYYEPPACLRILDPYYDRAYPFLPKALQEALPLSAVSRIDQNNGIEVNYPSQIFPEQRMDSWCYYFEKADLARQNTDWQKISQLGDLAFALNDSPNHASERLPFIEAYAMLGNWHSAVDLSIESIRINKFMDHMLCDTWARIDLATVVSAEKDLAYNELSEWLSCL